MTGLRIGHGYDVHRLVEGRKLILGGVEIPWERGLLEQVNVKATTEEGLGFTGDGSGMAAHAVVLLEQVSKRDAL